MNDEAPPVWEQARIVGLDIAWGVIVPSIYGPSPILRGLNELLAKKVAALINDAYETGREHGEEITRRMYQ